MTVDSPAVDKPGPQLIHEALLYRTRQELQRTIRGFLADAADAGEPVLAMLPAGNLNWLPDALGEPARSVRFDAIDGIGSNPSRLLSAMQEWIEAHEGHARVISEPVWPGRTYAEIVECVRHEALVNRALADRPATILCPYDATHLDADTLAGAALTHPRLVGADGVSRPNPGYEDPERVVVAERWPLLPPPGPVSEHPFTGELYELRRALNQDPMLGRLRTDRREDLVFAINEAVTNAVRYGDARCRTRIWEDGSTVVSEVSSTVVGDGGSQTDLSYALAGRLRPRLDAAGGRGLWLINQVCDLVELRCGDGMMTLRMHVRA